MKKEDAGRGKLLHYYQIWKNMNARKTTTEKKEVTYIWLTKIFSTRLFHSGKTRSQAISQRRPTLIFL